MSRGTILPPSPSSRPSSTTDKTSPSPGKTGHGLRKPWIHTPLVESAILSKKAGCRIFLKLENLQPGGSFKSRAMGSLILYHIQSPSNAGRQLHFFINSGGNAGLAAVCAARSLSYPCTVVLPLTASRLMVEKLQAAGATQVIQYGDTIAAAGEYMRDVVMEENGSSSINNDDDFGEGSKKPVKKIALHPFDHEAIWEGNSTIIDELAYQLPPSDKKIDEEEVLPVDALICSVGGGGLMNGLIQGIERQRRQQQQEYSNTETAPRKNIHIVAVETDGTQSMNLAMSARALVTLPKITSMAVSLACVRVSQKTFEYCLSPPPGVVIHSAVLSDAAAARGCLCLADDERILVELACGVCIEAAVGGRDGDNEDVVPHNTNIGLKKMISHQSTSSQKNLRASEGILKHDEGYYGEDNEHVRQDEDSGSPLSCPSDSGIASDTESDISLGRSTQLSPSYLRQLVPELTPESRVVIIVCGGSNVTTGLASEWREKLANGWI